MVVSNDACPAHIAAALGTPVVDLCALTNPQHAPWQVESGVLFHDVRCRYCYKSVCPQGHHKCLAGVEPERGGGRPELVSQGSRIFPGARRVG